MKSSPTPSTAWVASVARAASAVRAAVSAVRAAVSAGPLVRLLEVTWRHLPSRGFELGLILLVQCTVSWHCIRRSAGAVKQHPKARRSSPLFPHTQRGESLVRVYG